MASSSHLRSGSVSQQTPPVCGWSSGRAAPQPPPPPPSPPPPPALRQGFRPRPVMVGCAYNVSLIPVLLNRNEAELARKTQERIFIEAPGATCGEGACGHMCKKRKNKTKQELDIYACVYLITKLVAFVNERALLCGRDHPHRSKLPAKTRQLPSSNENRGGTGSVRTVAQSASASRRKIRRPAEGNGLLWVSPSHPLQ